MHIIWFDCAVIHITAQFLYKLTTFVLLQRFFKLLQDDETFRNTACCRSLCTCGEGREASIQGDVYV